MRVDVSEVKTYRECHRKHQFSSRNRFHLRAVAPNDNLVFGTQFHEVLAMMYLGTSLDKILEWINKEVTDSVAWKVMDNMAQGYYNGPYQQDKDRFVVIDIEKSFNYPIAVRANLGVDPAYYGIEYLKDDKDEWYAIDGDGEVYETINICGSIDMVCIDVKTGKMVGFEHKTAKNFRPEVYDLLDEQPRVYTWALKRILDDYHKQGKYLEVTEVGPIYLNQVKKLQTKFDHQRSVCEYTENDLNAFMQNFINTAKSISIHESDIVDKLPQPGFMKCQMCDYADLCMHYGYAELNKEELLKEFDGEFEQRDCDHLDEKAQRHNNEAD